MEVQGLNKSRNLILWGSIGGILGFYILYLFYLQVLQGEFYQKRATSISQQSVPIYAQRGEIYDRNFDVPLVSNVDSFAVDLIPAEVPKEERDAIYGKLASYLKVPMEEIKKKIPSSLENLYQPIEIKSRVSLETLSYLAENIDEFPGLTWHNKPIRNYTQGKSLAHVLGYVGDITREELQVLFNKGYTYGSVLGKSGIEKQYDLILRGEDGKQFRTVDVKGRRVGEALVQDVPPTLGKTLVLTIDRKIQKLCEDALGNRIGSVVVLKPSTGEVLALVSNPSYDPNLFYDERGNFLFRDLSLDPKFPFLNRAIQSAYVPASTFKTILTTAAIEEEAIPLQKTITCTGSYTLGDRVFYCHRRSGHGPLNLFGALAESCNVFFYTLGSEYLGVEKIVEYAQRFGLGEKTGIDLPGEVSGVVPSPAWKKRVYNSRWVGGDTVNLSIGQGQLLVTPIQMANAMAMVVNGGTVYKPHLLKEVRDPISGKVVEEVKPEVLSVSTIQESTFKLVRDALRYVVTSGTPKPVITTKAVQVAGKTGTGEVGFDDRWHSWFVAYAPYNDDDPREKIVLVVQVEAANEWEWWAPKAANIIFHGIFTGMSYHEVLASMDLWYLKATSGGER
ncbi:MAG: penicillin-binding protein 2 [Spirochaetes bacterium]|nr:penicillin-binding protein 2 [Spirochaetota bacterium]